MKFLQPLASALALNASAGTQSRRGSTVQPYTPMPQAFPQAHAAALTSTAASQQRKLPQVTQVSVTTNVSRLPQVPSGKRSSSSSTAITASVSPKRMPISNGVMKAATIDLKAGLRHNEHMLVPPFILDDVLQLGNANVRLEGPHDAILLHRWARERGLYQPRGPAQLPVPGVAPANAARFLYQGASHHLVRKGPPSTRILGHTPKAIPTRSGLKMR